MSVDDWRQRVVGMIEAAEAHHSHGAAMKGIEMLGRHIGALGAGAAGGSLTQEFFSFLRAHAEPDLALESSEDTIDTTIADVVDDDAIASDGAKGGV
jgi:20S proteasome alpha/beta subunit